MSYYNSYNPVTDRLYSLTWDGEDRLTTIAQSLFNLEEKHDNIIFEYIFRGAVARALSPGCEYPYMPVIRSDKQGLGKTTFLKILGNAIAQNGFNSAPVLGTTDYRKRLREEARGKSVLEQGEVENLTGRTLGVLNDVVTQTNSSIRDAFAHNATTADYTHITVMTTNEHYLFDSKGELRRYPVVDLKDNQLNERWLVENIDQLLAQCVSEYELGSAVRIPSEYWKEMSEISANYIELSSLSEFMDNEVSNIVARTTLATLIPEMRHKGVSGFRKGEITNSLRRLGYEYKPVLVNRKTKKVWQLADLDRDDYMAVYNSRESFDLEGKTWPNTDPSTQDKF